VKLNDCSSAKQWPSYNPRELLHDLHPSAQHNASTRVEAVFGCQHAPKAMGGSGGSFETKRFLYAFHLVIDLDGIRIDTAALKDVPRLRQLALFGQVAGRFGKEGDGSEDKEEKHHLN